MQVLFRYVTGKESRILPSATRNPFCHFEVSFCGLLWDRAFKPRSASVVGGRLSGIPSQFVSGIAAATSSAEVAFHFLLKIERENRLERFCVCVELHALWYAVV